MGKWENGEMGEWENGNFSIRIKLHKICGICDCGLDIFEK
jgi:hypothetical protein